MALIAVSIYGMILINVQKLIRGNHMLATNQKITAYVPRELLHDAQAFTGLGITETLKAGLTELITARAYEEVRQFRGKVKTSINLKELRKDRDEA